MKAAMRRGVSIVYRVNASSSGSTYFARSVMCAVGTALLNPSRVIRAVMGKTPSASAWCRAYDEANDLSKRLPAPSWGAFRTHTPPVDVVSWRAGRAGMHARITPHREGERDGRLVNQRRTHRDEGLQALSPGSHGVQSRERLQVQGGGGALLHAGGGSDLEARVRSLQGGRAGGADRS